MTHAKLIPLGTDNPEHGQSFFTDFQKLQPIDEPEQLAPGFALVAGYKPSDGPEIFYHCAGEAEIESVRLTEQSTKPSIKTSWYQGEGVVVTSRLLFLDIERNRTLRTMGLN